MRKISFDVLLIKKNSFNYTNWSVDIMFDTCDVSSLMLLTHWGQVMHIYVSVNYTIIGSDNGLSPVRRQTIIWTNDGLLSIRPLGTCFIEISLEIQKFSFKNMHMKMLSAKMMAILSRPQCVSSVCDIVFFISNWICTLYFRWVLKCIMVVAKCIIKYMYIMT